MTIPKYCDMYRAFLDCLMNNSEHSMKEIKEKIASKLNVTPEEQTARFPSGKQSIYDNRISWACTYLKKAGLIENVSRGVFVLTGTGKDALIENPSVIDNNYLSRFEGFNNFIHRSTESDDVMPSLTETPQDTLDKAFAQINSSLADDLMPELMKQSPSFFEHAVVKLLEKMGYGGSMYKAGLVVGQTNDEGIDGIVYEDKLGFSRIYIQAKRWEINCTVGRPEIQKFVGALVGQGASKGLFITTSQFSKEAVAYASKQHSAKIVLVDGTKLIQYMMEYNLGVSVETVYEIKSLDNNFFNN